MDFKKTVVLEVEVPVAGYALIRFEGEKEVSGEPGQFVMVRGSWGVHPVLPRAFSLVEAGRFGAILVKSVGEATKLLAAIKPGDELNVLGPLGHGFDCSVSNKGNPVLVAGGVGVAPLFFLAERLASAGETPLFLFGAKTHLDLPLRRRIERSFETVITTEDGSAGEKGLVIAPLKRIVQSNSNIRIYSCGPEGLLEAVATVAVSSGAFCQIALESPMACGMGTCKGCAILAADGRYKYVCSDGPAFDAAQIFGGGR